MATPLGYFDREATNKAWFDPSSATQLALFDTTLLDSAPSSPVSVTPNLGSLTATGLAPTVVLGTQVQQGLGAPVVTGLAPSVVLGIKVSLGLGVLTVTGLSPTVVLGTRVFPGVGAPIVTGGAPVVGAVIHAIATVVTSTNQIAVKFLAAINFPSPLVAGDRTATHGMQFSLNGIFIDPEYVSGNNTDTILLHLLDPVGPNDVIQFEYASGVGFDDWVYIASGDLVPIVDAYPVINQLGAFTNLGSPALTGLAPTIKLGTRVLVDPGALSVTGLAPSVVVSNNKSTTLGVGDVQLTGEAPAVVINNKVFLGFGVLTITGLSPAVSVGVRIVTDIGALVATGEAPTVVASDNKRITPGFGDVQLVGFAPSATLNIRAVPSVGDIQLTGQAPSPVIGLRVTTDVGSVQLTGFEPAVALSVRISPSVGDIQLTGFPPTIVTDVRISLNVGTLQLTGFEPTVDIIASGNAVVRPGAGQLFFDGFEPDVAESEEERTTIDELRRRALVDPEEEERKKKQKPYAEILQTLQASASVPLPVVKAEIVPGPIKARAILKSRAVLKGQVVLQGEVVTVHEVTAHTVHQATAIPIIDPMKKKTIFGRLIRVVKGRLSNALDK